MESVKEWLKISDGSGSGSGYGYGSGDGSGYGYGSGDGDGYGDGYGDGSGYGYGYGDGDGDGDGSGYGYGSGSGSGYGDGSGSGSGYGYGSGSGYGVKTINGMNVYIVDGIQTIIKSVKLSLAKGFILDSDLTLKKCYIAKDGRFFAHGETAREAQNALRAKIFENMNTDEAIEKFLETFKKGEKYQGELFFEWHHYLTGSCEMGRKSFVRSHDIDLDNMYTVDEFIALCENDYGSEVIKKLKEVYNSNQ